MKGFQKCSNGHFFKEDLSLCPYCPKDGSAPANSPEDRTQYLGGTSGGNTGSTDLGKTQVVGGGMTVNTNVSGTQIFGQGQSAKGHDPNKTFIQDGSDENQSGQPVTARATRKLTGWLVSYTLDPMGFDFKIYEGQNTIGKDPRNSITIAKDSAISGHHLTLLCRSGKFYVSDEMSSNGTRLNSEELELRKPYELKDGDELKIGSTLLKFKCAL
jgi:hypothetical protein